MKGAKWLTVVIAVAITGGACDGKPSPPYANQPPPLTEHRSQALTTASPKLNLGDDCSLTGSAGCLSGLCFKTGLKRDTGYRCSTACVKDNDCPNSWSCQQVYPSAAGFFCVPPREDGAFFGDAGSGP